MSRLALVFAGVVAACGGSQPVEPTIPVQKKPEPPPVIEWSKLVGPIKTVDVATPDATLVAKVKETFAPVIGKPLDRSTLRDSLTIATTLAGVADISARATQLADGIAVTLDVTPQPPLHALAAREVGGKDLPLPGQLSSAIGLPVDPSLLDALGNQLVETYLSNGYADASVAWKQTQAGSAGVDVAVEVTPGKASIISSIDFQGNSHAKKADLAKLLTDTFPANAPWTIDRVMRGQFLVTSYYYDHGFVNVAVEQPKPAGTTAPLIYTIIEGDQFRVGKLEFTDKPAESKKYLGMLGIKPGDIFNRSAVSAGIEKLNASLKAEDRAFVPITNIDTKKKVIDLKFELQKS
ncbi:MAG TPA: POTRA domain-containing protein [Kofleriaceae bacterium]|jgi:outer membrane protein assembly factor BamA|nr:POTRA domain-containing protein [Kofleriaceae bacterium]